VNLTALSTAHLRALHRIAKHPTKGLKPFFTDPRVMKALREELERREAPPVTVTVHVPDDTVWEAAKAATKRPTFFGVRT
jgi:hypothetical protein